MNHIRRPLVGLIALFTAAITIDRVGLDHGSGAIPPRAYVLAASAAIVPLVSRNLRVGRAWSLPSAAVAAEFVLATLTGSGPAATEFQPHVAATSAAFITLAAVIGRSVAVGVAGMADALGDAAIGDVPALDVEGPAAANEIHTEMARSRRHGRPLSVTVVTAESDSFEAALKAAGPEVQRALRKRFVFGRITRAVGEQLRRSDLLFEHRPSGKLFVLSPETGDEGTALLMERIRTAALRTGVEIVAGSATFPSDAVSFEHLVESAERDLEERSHEPELRAVLEGGSS